MADDNLEYYPLPEGYGAEPTARVAISPGMGDLAATDAYSPDAFEAAAGRVQRRYPSAPKVILPERAGDGVMGSLADLGQGLAAAPGNVGRGAEAAFNFLSNPASYATPQPSPSGAIQPPPYVAPGQGSRAAQIGGAAIGVPIKRAATLLSVPHDVATGEFDPMLNSTEAADLAAEAATSLVGQGMRFARPGGFGMAGGRAVQPARLAPDTPTMGSIAEPRLATPEEINRAARASQRGKGVTGRQLQQTYADLGLTGRSPVALAQPSLASAFTPEQRAQATNLKLADLAVVNRFTPEQRRIYREKQELPEGVSLPSQLAVLPQLQESQRIKAQVEKAETAFDAATAAGTAPPPLFDLSAETLRRTPDVPQFNLPRQAPKRTERIDPAGTGGLRRLERAAANAPMSNWGWYNLMQTRDLFHAIHGPQRGEQAFQTWLDGVAGTSMVNPIDNNVRSSTWYLQQVLQGKPLPETFSVIDPETGRTTRAMVGGPPPGYGAKSQIQHADRVREFITNDYDPVKNPKPISYRMNLGGNWMPRTVDTHDIRNMVGMPYGAGEAFTKQSSLLPGEYTYLENLGRRAAVRADAPQASQQAATWVGGGIPSPQYPNKGGYTGLKSFPAPLQEVINRRAYVTGMVRGITPEQALHDAFTGRAPLLGLGGAAVAAPAIMGGLAQQDNYQ